MLAAKLSTARLHDASAPAEERSKRADLWVFARFEPKVADRWARQFCDLPSTIGTAPRGDPASACPQWL